MTAILVGMSAGVDPDALTGLARAADAEVAFLQVHDPALIDVLTSVADRGASDVLLIGAGWAQSGPKRSWLRRVAAHWLRSYDGAPTLRLAPQLLAAPDEELLAAAIAAGGTPMADDAAPLHSPAWEKVPRHRHQVLVCRGPRCSALGASALTSAFGDELRRAGLGDDDALVTVTGCQFPCNHAPVVTVQPDDAWYGRVTVDEVPGLVEAHLLNEERAAHLLLPRERSAARASAEYSDRGPRL
ncbi:(2Fe-2S) ferredoxin domain-containing protein [Tsukamurella ocularis]|uniref:(2Fe-2S) ferredoxin domain-containing protein n=1 Tax=Tsukamurella ocularis TaxID=1970234 RepID=UPI0021698EBA|nr:(2Fe-2S) ferredoxin domain-containing protein [Tsukamurella ocularis]MCS3780321.1 (2Fe-2S) ferredoxin [Tsukamurella ocularis]MCS3786124.1 (2Fe-2S) ferredoxin [Tsukamurella ocularis]MCS3849488.1 (2Fe-2S) ferredoxin [Tsukamurella ocularis]